MSDGADRADVWIERRRVARKPHKCSECGRDIAKGDAHRWNKTLYEGLWNETRQCHHCMVLADWLVAECGGYLTEGIVEDFSEHANEYRRFDLLRMAWGAKHRWRRNGSLLPVPAMPLTSEQRAPVGEGKTR